MNTTIDVRLEQRHWVPYKSAVNVEALRHLKAIKDGYRYGILFR
ncbi:hypothetical protein ACFVTM_04000 [Arthrobacter sp. NPDC058130]